jgi:LPS-assembly lipoprotein
MVIKFIPLLTLIILSFGLSACGFTPVHSTAPTTKSVSNNLNSIEIAIIPNRSGQYLRNALIDKLYSNGYPSNPRYKLTIEPLQEIISDFDVTIDSDATRRQLKLITNFNLTDKNNKTLLNRHITAVTSNNVLVSEFSTIVTEQNARDAALDDLARQIETQLALYLNK